MTEYYKELLNHDKTFRYQMLSRLKMDCDYYLGYGNKSVNALWAENEIDQIEAMKGLWNSFSEDDKPEWLSWEDILKYEAEMVTLKKKLETATPLGKSYHLGEWEDIEELIKTLDSGMYGCKNSEGEDVLVLREVGEGLEVLTFQCNGWLRVNYYTEKGHDDGETFKGRWDKSN